jgi:cyclophilin family peptidyl-prolyl cis-trans isomerase
LKPTLYSLVIVLFAFAACSQTGDTSTTTTAEATTTTASTQSMADVPLATDTTPAAAPAAKETSMSAYENKIAEIHTTAGEIDIRFFPEVAPNHVKNFIDLAQKGFYEGIKFHRVIPGFMIQVGDPNTIKGDPSTWGSGGSPQKLKAEFNNIPHRRGIISAARTNDPNSASSQFFIVVADSNFLDGKYTVYGEVVRGMDVADKIVAAPRDANDRPNNPTSITKVVIRDAREDEKKPAQ